MIDYENLTREELIELLKDLETKRAFSFEDQMKLLILDESPFTIWASDRNCKITFWSGKCESLYGYTASQAMGQDYTVAERCAVSNTLATIILVMFGRLVLQQ